MALQCRRCFTEINSCKDKPNVNVSITDVSKYLAVGFLLIIRNTRIKPLHIACTKYVYEHDMNRIKTFLILLNTAVKLNPHKCEEYQVLFLLEGRRTIPLQHRVGRKCAYSDVCRRYNSSVLGKHCLFITLHMLESIA